MRTVDEIAISVDANYAFWTAYARLYLTLYREHKSVGTAEYAVYARLSKAGFRNALRSRRERLYLDTSQLEG